MTRAAAFLLALLVSLPAAADMYPDASNATYSVTSYGAKCDGTTDDSAAIQAAANSTTSAKIVFPAGKTCVAANVTFGAGRTVDCQGATIKAPAAGSVGKWIFKRTGSLNVVANCRFDDSANATMISTTLAAVAGPRGSCIVTTPTFLLGTTNLRVNAAIVSSASAPANQFWVSTAGQN